MGESIYFKPTVVRTNRGLSISGTRTTIYQIMDYIKDNEAPEVIREHFRLTIKQTADVMNYIREHYDEVDKEYQRILNQSEENRKYWAEHNRERFAEIARKPEHIRIRAKLDQWKAKLAQNDSYTG